MQRLESMSFACGGWRQGVPCACFGSNSGLPAILCSSLCCAWRAVPNLGHGVLHMHYSRKSALYIYHVRNPSSCNVLPQLDLAGRLRARRRATPAEFVATLELQERRYKEVGAAPLHWRHPLTLNSL